MRPGHPGQFHPGKLSELLDRKQPKPAATNDPQSHLPLTNLDSQLAYQPTAGVDPTTRVNGGVENLVPLDEELPGVV